MSSVNCPSCGAYVGDGSTAVRMIACPYCGTTSFLKDKAVLATGGSGVMHEAPQLLTLGVAVDIEGTRYTPLGHARFSYGRGEWDEYWVESDAGVPAWVSVDEGDVVIQTVVPPGRAPKFASAPALGAHITLGHVSFTVSEVETARCIALRGLFDELLTLGETYRFFNCSGPRGQLLSGELGPEGWVWFLGNWVDPFRVRPA